MSSKMKDNIQQMRQEQNSNAQHRNWIPHRLYQPSTSGQQTSSSRISPSQVKQADSSNRRHQNSDRNAKDYFFQSNLELGQYYIQSNTVKPVSMTYLKNLISKESNEILFSISQKDSPFMAFIEQRNIRTDMMALVIISIGKACLGDLQQTLISFLIAIHYKAEFFISLQIFMLSLRMYCMNEILMESVFYLIVFLQKLQFILPSSSTHFISLLLPILRFRCEISLSEQSFYGDVIQKLQEIEEQNEHFLNQYTECKNKEASNIHKMTEPPENFRLLPIIPTADDINSEAFLRRNLVDGKYENTEHYLDVQYRLLREDYLQPLRDGIKEYLKLKEANKSVKNIQNIRVYENVHIVKQGIFKERMIHFAAFQVKDVEGINWKEGKHFLPGSLLCLSSDRFKSVTFATVFSRIPDHLKNGILVIRFEDITEEVLNISPSQDFVVLETLAYFEAYRYNLKALQDLNEDILPFKKYIVDVETNVNNVPYIDLSTTYDLRPLLLPMDSKLMERIEMMDGDFAFHNEFDTEYSKDLRSVQLLKDSSWPSALDLCLDDSQYLALKAALTKEFTIIQGPPGTGKTYIGLRIAQLLLHNLEKWFTRDFNSLPILVVCYTNHALDQFLEGMMNFTDKIVRIGGKVTDKPVSNFHLCKIRKEAFHNGDIPKYMLDDLWNHQNELFRIKHEMTQLFDTVQRCVDTVLCDNELKDYIPYSQYCSLKSIQGSQKFQDLKLIDDNLIIHDWLDIRSRLDEEDVIKSNKIEGTLNHEFSENDEKKEENELNEQIEFVDVINSETNESDEDDLIPINTLNLEEREVSSADLNLNIGGVKNEELELIKNRLITSKPLKESEVHTISDVWNMDLERRWSLYKYWVENMISEKNKEILELQRQLNNQYEQLQEMKTEEDVLVLQNAQVVGMTTTGVAKYRELVQRLNPQILIVEEAAEILESHIVTSLAPNTQHIILIGDHQQLRPSPTVHKLAVKYNLNISLFERMIKNKMNCYKLTLQHRMNPEIADLIASHIYHDLKNHESVTKYENVKGVDKNVFFIDHDHRELQEKGSKSKINVHEAKFLIKLCLYLVQQDYNPGQIAILATYSGQVKLLKNIQSKIEIIQDVKITTVDNYQGEENDIILISFVRSNEEDDIGFLNISNRVCVAMSRAKKGMYCIGNFKSLAKKSKLWKNITKSLSQKKEIGKSLKLICQNHPSVITSVAHENDFIQISEGGCSKTCEFRLPCGHLCSLTCHPYDKMHKNICCLKPCKKTCNEGHGCQKKCSEDCGSCEHLVDKTLPSCKHTIVIPCGEQHMDKECSADCDKVLSCGHKCPNKCGATCVAVCKEIITVKSSICGHNVAVECRFKFHSEELIKNCTNPCNTILQCGHKCTGNCNLCRQGRLHVDCMEPCKKILVCGHECKSNCAKGCLPCKLPCENRCVHSKCSKECGVPCDLCTEKCEWSCPHAKCSRLCKEMCDRDPCNQPCLKLLQCGHQCVGFCGDPCPKLCRICDIEELEELFFGTEDESDARFVQLEDCDHILEITGLNKWMSSETDDLIQMKVCPKCKSVVRTNFRYCNTVKCCLEKIEERKKFTFGGIEELQDLREQLTDLLHENIDILQNLKCRGSSFYETCENALSSKHNLNKQEINIMTEVVRCSLFLASLESYEVSPVLSSYMRASEIWLMEFMGAEILTASKQQLQQIVDEIRRLEICHEFSDYIFRLKLQNTETQAIRFPNPDYEKCISILTSYSHFTQDKRDSYFEALVQLATFCGTPII